MTTTAYMSNPGPRSTIHQLLLYQKITKSVTLHHNLNTCSCASILRLRKDNMWHDAIISVYVTHGTLHDSSK